MLKLIVHKLTHIISEKQSKIVWEFKLFIETESWNKTKSSLIIKYSINNKMQTHKLAFGVKEAPYNNNLYNS